MQLRFELASQTFAVEHLCPSDERQLFGAESEYPAVNYGSFGADPIVDLVGRKQSVNSSSAEADLHN
jgi:hypothetical protein